MHQRDGASIILYAARSPAHDSIDTLDQADTSFGAWRGICFLIALPIHPSEAKNSKPMAQAGR